ncbi:hypothetical protein ACFRCX_30715 [Streptomyces sp. NPDC056652]|uniref:hypothetical protein n=1 Tax=Streptomyces sp. NPDC056652 TaxID=3345893 RepID=UPI003673C273
MPELRLIDPDGYTVPDTVHTVSGSAVDETRQHLLTDIAPAHAAEWADFGYDARNYRVT